MNLDIIILHYKEDIDTVLVALNSINRQKNYDFSNLTVTIVNDYDAIDLNFSGHTFNFTLKQIRIPKKKTLGELRQYALEKTSGDYFLWCDADDSLLDDTYLSFIDSTLKNKDIEILLTPYYKEVLIDDAGSPENKYIYLKVNASEQISTLHGKVFNRAFIKKYNIHFPALNISEDVYFVFMCLPYCQKSLFFGSEHASYIYRHNTKSVTKTNNPFGSDPIATLRQHISGFKAQENFLDIIINDERSIISKSLLTPFLLSQYYGYMVSEEYARQRVEYNAQLLETKKTEYEALLEGFITSDITKESLDEFEKLVIEQTKEFEELTSAGKAFFRQYNAYIDKDYILNNEKNVSGHYGLKQHDFISFLGI